MAVSQGHLQQDIPKYLVVRGLRDFLSTGQGNRTLLEINVMSLLAIFPSDRSRRRAASMMDNTGIKKKKINLLNCRYRLKIEFKIRTRSMLRQK